MASQSMDDEMQLLVRQTTTMTIKPSNSTRFDMTMTDRMDSPSQLPWIVPTLPSQIATEVTKSKHAPVEAKKATTAARFAACGPCAPATTAAVFTAASKAAMREVEEARVARLNAMWQVRREMKQKESMKQKSVLALGAPDREVEMTL